MKKKETNILPWLITFVGILTIGIVGLFLFARHYKAEVISFVVDRENNAFVVTGKNLSRIELWAVPTGTDITPERHILISKSMQQITSQQQNQKFVTLIPDEPFLATLIFIRAFDKRGVLFMTKELPYIGATEIHNAIWGNPNPVMEEESSL